jgi:hypothetical protein
LKFYNIAFIPDIEVRIAVGKFKSNLSKGSLVFRGTVTFMAILNGLLTRGYFPKELPPRFDSEMFGISLSQQSNVIPEIATFKNWTKPCSYNLARAGNTRRKLSILNPISFYRLANCVAENWEELDIKARTSHLSLSTLVETSEGRALKKAHDLNERPAQRAKLRAHSKYVLCSDISRFYPSIYTHTIPWAIDGKKAAKTNMGDKNRLGNKLDKLSQFAQDGQTFGIPIGPDTSHMIAEILLSAVDSELKVRGLQKGLRFVDDYEFGFRTLSEAEEGLAKFREVLAMFELELNEAKTNIFKLPITLEDTAFSELRCFRFQTFEFPQKTLLFKYFDRAFELASQKPKEGILKYAISRLSSVKIEKDTWPLYSDLLLQCASSEPGTLRYVLGQLLVNKGQGKELDNDAIAAVLNQVIEDHSPLGHTSEVA